jgi:hypothetical protein
MWLSLTGVPLSADAQDAPAMDPEAAAPDARPAPEAGHDAGSTASPGEASEAAGAAGDAEPHAAPPGEAPDAAGAAADAESSSAGAAGAAPVDAEADTPADASAPADNRTEAPAAAAPDDGQTQEATPDGPPADFLEITQQLDGRCQMLSEGGKLTVVKNTHPSRTIRYRLVRLFYGKPQGGRIVGSIAPADEPQALGCNLVDQKPQTWEIERAEFAP